MKGRGQVDGGAEEIQSWKVDMTSLGSVYVLWLKYKVAFMCLTSPYEPFPLFYFRASLGQLCWALLRHFC